MAAKVAVDHDGPSASEQEFFQQERQPLEHHITITEVQGVTVTKSAAQQSWILTQNVSLMLGYQSLIKSGTFLKKKFFFDELN